MNKQSGAVSLFVVIFAMLIITVVTVSFLRLMISDQQQASDNDLSRSAYDSAQAGVEDAKRALLRYQRVCSDDPSQCANLSAQLSTDVCNAAVLQGGVIGTSDVSGGTPGNPGEIIVKQSVTNNDQALNQAYTCVTIDLETTDYVGTLAPNQSQIVPLIGTSGFDTVTLRWFSRDDFSSTTGAVDRGSVGEQQLLSQENWPANRPSVLRSQLIQFGDSFRLEDFDIVSGSESNANTLFLYPSSVGSTSDVFVGRDIRKSNPGAQPVAATVGSAPLPVQCAASVSSGGYACAVSLRLPTPIGGGDRTAFLRVTPFYQATHFQVVLSNGGAPDTNGTNVIRFKDVQPVIDSTGRANDLFRRVQSRVDLFDTSFPYPDATIQVTNDFCKDFSVTDDEYIPGSCTP